MSGKIVIQNRRASFDYEIIETLEAGIVLQGTEVKSLRAAQGSLAEAYVVVRGGEVFLVHATIMPYKFGNRMNHEEKRDRKLLLHKREIEFLRRQLEEKGLTVVPLSLKLVQGKMKLVIGLARGKKLYDKRQTVRDREDARRVQKAIKDHT